MKSSWSRVLAVAVLTTFVATCFANVVPSVSGSAAVTVSATTDLTSFTYATVGEPYSLDPASDSELSGMGILQNVYENLVWYDGPRADVLVPVLATEVPTVENGLVSSDGLAYTLHVAPGVKFHDGTFLTADDVVYSIQRVLRIHDHGGPCWMLEQVLTDYLSYNLGHTVAEYLATSNNAPWIVDVLGPLGADHSITEADVQAVAEVAIVKIDEMTVMFRLTHAYPGFVSILAAPVCSIVSMDYVESHGGVVGGEYNGWMNTHTCGSGPYMVDTWVMGSSISLKRFDAYHGALPALVDVHIVYANDLNTRLLMLQDGAVDSINMDSMYEYLVAGDPNVVIFKGSPTLNLDFAAFNFHIDSASSNSVFGGTITDDFFCNEHMRRAFAHLVDYASLLAQSGNSMQPNGPIPMGMMGYDPNVPVYAFDLAAAQAELEQVTNPSTGNSWWVDGFTIPLFFRAGNVFRQSFLENLRSGLRGLGDQFDATLVALDPSTFAQQIYNSYSYMPMLVIGWAPDYADPDDYATPFLDSMHSSFYPFSGYVNPAVDDIVRQAAAELDSTVRATLYSQLSLLVHDDSPYLWLRQPLSFQVMRSWVTGYYYNPMFYELYFASLSKVAPVYTPHDPIMIYGDSGFTSENGVVGGSGTASEPYIISGWEIDASGYQYAIGIFGSSAFFEIANCNLHSSGSYGIYLNGVSNGFVHDNICSDNSFGMSLYSSSDNTICNNTCSDNSFGMSLCSSSDNTICNNMCSNNFYGMFLYSSSDDNTLRDNTCSSNGDMGIYIYSSSDNTLSNNTCSSNTLWSGIQIGPSSDNMICNNTCNSNGEDGILLWSYVGTSSGNTVCNNTCSGNFWEGIELRSSNDNTLSNNTCSYNGDEGIWLDSSSGNTLDNSSCISNALDGIGIGSSSDNVLSDNNCSSNGECGIWLGIWSGSLSNDNTLINNTCSSNNGCGIVLESSSYNILVNNTCSSDRDFGICLVSSSNNNVLINNTCSSNGCDGIYLYMLDSYNVVCNNSCGSNNWNGIELGSSSDNNVLINNTCSNNFCDGIYLYSSSDDTIRGNTCRSNHWHGMQLDFSNDNIVCNNTCSLNGNSGIWHLSSSGNALVNNTCSSNDNVGIGLDYSSNIIIRHNTCSSNLWNGIHLGSGDMSNTISNNTCSSNTENGIYLGLSCANIICDNICNSNNQIGIFLVVSSNFNTLKNNTCSNNDYFGILLSSSHDNTLSNNTCSNNDYSGILLSSSHDCILSENNCSNNAQRGMEIDSSSHNTILNNTCSDNYYNGIFLGWSSDNTVCNNTCSSNDDTGIWLYLSSDNLLSNNTCSSNYRPGMNIILSSDNTISNNTCSSNGYEGIIIDSSSHNTICNNTCNSNVVDGILLWIWSGGSSSENTICNNTCSNNVLEGIELVSSSDNTVSNNTCSYNGDEGIWLDSSNSNTLDNNSCISNYLDGIGIGSSSDNILCDNTFSSNGEDGIWLGTWIGLGNLPGSLSNNNKITRNQLCGNSRYGVFIDSGSNNRIWGNTFCNNNGARDVYDRRHVQAFDSGTGNWWNSADGHGNRWMDWRGPDLTPAYGIVDYPYHIAGTAHSCDYYPLATSPPDPMTLTDTLIKAIQSWHLSKGTTTGLTSKLFDAMGLLKKGNVNGALHNLMDFVSMVHAQEGKQQLTSDQAAYALASAEQIMDLLT